jgi:hypothetical protein
MTCRLRARFRRSFARASALRCSAVQCRSRSRIAQVGEQVLVGREGLLTLNSPPQMMHVRTRRRLRQSRQTGVSNEPVPIHSGLLQALHEALGREASQWRWHLPCRPVSAELVQPSAEQTIPVGR